MLRRTGPALALSVLIALIPAGALFSYFYPYSNHPEHQSRASTNHSDKEEVDKIVAAFTGVIVIIGMAQAYLFFWQLSLIRVGLADAKEAADAAGKTAKATGDAVGISRETAIRQLRAYVLIDEARIDLNPATSWYDAHISFKNYGTTPSIFFQSHY